MIKHNEISDCELRQKIKSQSIKYGGNSNLKIYGQLDCTSGKRMHQKNRVFFATKHSAEENDYRPCGHCMRQEYEQWTYLNR
jgi:methylphosphotriester-DNA--protein-cysteine methyltransferase